MVIINKLALLIKRTNGKPKKRNEEKRDNKQDCNTDDDGNKQ